jgi:hypothetical protein
MPLTVVDHAEAALERLTLQDIADLPPARRRKLADLCWHWFQLADGHRYRVVETGKLADLVAETGQAKPVGVLGRLKRGDRSS